MSNIILPGTNTPMKRLAIKLRIEKVEDDIIRTYHKNAIITVPKFGIAEFEGIRARVAQDHQTQAELVTIDFFGYLED